jgi:hypothetical protein
VLSPKCALLPTASDLNARTVSAHPFCAFTIHARVQYTQVWLGAGSIVDAPVVANREIVLQSVSETHGHVQWKGDGTAAHPDMFNRNLFAFFPSQSSDTRFVLTYYVMTVNITVPLPDEDYTLVIDGFKAEPTLTCVDPVNGGAAVPVTGVNFAKGLLTVTVSATDTPRMIVAVEDGTPGPAPPPPPRPSGARMYLQSAYTNASQFTQVRMCL